MARVVAAAAAAVSEVPMFPVPVTGLRVPPANDGDASGRLIIGDWNGFLRAAFAASTRLCLAAGVDMIV